MSSIAKNQAFTAVYPVGALLPNDMLLRIRDDRDTPGSAPADYHLAGDGSVRNDAERRWDYLKSAWRVLRDKLPPIVSNGKVNTDPTGLAVTGWLEPLFAELSFGRLRKTADHGITSDDGTKHFAISHYWEHIPVHLTAWNADLDKRPTPGIAPPQSLVQECLNRTEAHLWAILSNGRQLRLLRDSTSLVGASYIEFDLEAIFDGELFSEFVLLYRLLHSSRFETADEAPASTCWLGKWRNEAIETGTRALEQLREGVETALTSLGTGFLQHPANTSLREDLDTDLFKKALLRLVYRLVILFVAEDRDLLIHPDADPKARERYERYFSTSRLRATAAHRRGTIHTDRWHALRQVSGGLGREDGLPELGLPGLGGIFDDTETDKLLDSLELSNDALLTAIRALSIVRDASTKRNRAVDYRHLGAEELGSIYEALLELVPQHDPAARTFALVSFAGNERKTTGSYYTPTSLITCLLDSALDPVLDDAQKRGELAASKNPKLKASKVIAEELLKVTVCDPACGSGHFLVGAARRIAKRVAAVREQNPEPTLDAVRAALRDVVGRCVYGVDINPMAVELAKVSLWLEALEPGKALGFLDAHIKHGNALLGTTPALLADGIPDNAFKPIEGDDKKWVAALKKQNSAERSGQDSLFDLVDDVKITNVRFAVELQKIMIAKADTLADVHRQSSAFRAWEESPDYQHAKNTADTWCAAFVWIKTKDAPPAITESAFRALKDPDGAGASLAVREEIVRLKEQYNFFHWYLEFPDIFDVPPESGPTAYESTGWSGGFSCILGNPPWERIKLQEQEFFAHRNEAIATALNASVRKKLIAALPRDNPELAATFGSAKRASEGESHFLRMSKRYPLTGRGDINTYAVFAETDRALLSAEGRTGLVLPIGIGTDATTAPFFADLVRQRRLVSYLGFENEAYILSRAVHHFTKFCLFAFTGSGHSVEHAYFSSQVRYMDELPTRRFVMAPEEIMLVNPNTGTGPTFRTQRDANITTNIYRRIPVLLKQGDKNVNPWEVSFMAMFHMSNDSGLFRTHEFLSREGWELNGNRFTNGSERMLPLYEAKMLHHYDHRLGTYAGQTEAQAKMGTLPRLAQEQHSDPSFVSLPRYWVAESEVDAKLAAKSWDRGWLLGWRDITNATNERTMIDAVFPRNAAPDGTLLMLPRVSQVAGLVACLTSFVLDYATRQKTGGTHLKYFTVYQLPVSHPSQIKPHQAFITSRVLELTYTTYDMEPFARDLGDRSAPFRWDEERRGLLRGELDALFFHLYGIERDDVDYIMETLRYSA
jgi:hypothetical protein